MLERIKLSNLRIDETISTFYTYVAREENRKEKGR